MIVTNIGVEGWSGSREKREVRTWRWWGEECGTVSSKPVKFLVSLAAGTYCLGCLRVSNACTTSRFLDTGVFPSSFAHWYSHYFQLANTPSVVYPLEISLFLQFRPPSLPFLLFSFSFSLGEKRNAGFRGFFPTHNDDKQQQSCHEQRLSLRSISTSHYTPCHARGRWQLRKGIKHPLAKAPPKERGNWILRNRPRHLSCIWNFSTYLLRTSGDFFFFSRPKIARFALRVTRVFSEWQAWRRGTRVRNYYRREGESRLHRWPATKIIGAANFYE